MYRNHLILSIVTVLLLNISFVQAKNNVKDREDQLIILGLLYDEYKSYEDSYAVYDMLYQDTKEEVFLFRKINVALLGEIYLEKSLEELKTWIKEHKQTRRVRRLLIGLYLTLNQNEEAIKGAKALLKISSNPDDLYLASNAYFYGSKFKKSLELLSTLYEKAPREKILLRMSMIMDTYTKQRKEAIALLRTHLRLNLVVSHDVYFQLLSLYEKENDMEGVLEIYQLLFEKTKSEKYLSKIVAIYRYQHKIDKAIVFLEKNTKGSELLFELYKIKKKFLKAIALSDVLYQKENNAKWISEKGMLMIEQSLLDNNQSMLSSALKYFEKAIALGSDDSIYLNYYGYTLIDEEIDVKKGIKIIQDALLQQPKNTYYLDSLAWGYFKNNNCVKAFKFMKEVVDKEGLVQKEIVSHWSAIKECK